MMSLLQLLIQAATWSATELVGMIPRFPSVCGQQVVHVKLSQLCMSQRSKQSKDEEYSLLSTPSKGLTYLELQE